MRLTPEDQQRLLRLARRCLEARVRRETPPPVDRGGALDACMGAFVSVHHHGDLRGCLGRLETDRPIAENVAHLAAVVSDSDPRFTPIVASELSGLDLEISALTPEEEITDINAIEIGRHGLIIEHGHRRGLLLPQVATEYGWDRETFLDHTCLKAGLPTHAWRTGARIFIFEAQVFSEKPG
jgi:AmmeMemoRadiSam system protein A